MCRLSIISCIARKYRIVYCQYRVSLILSQNLSYNIIVTGVLSHVSIKHFINLKYSRLTKLLFLSSSYPKTQPLALMQERPLETVPVFFLIVYKARIDMFLERQQSLVDKSTNVVRDAKCLCRSQCPVLPRSIPGFLVVEK